MYIFLCLSLLSGVLELGIVLSTYAEGMSLWVVLTMVAMYQLGNLLYRPKRYGRIQVIPLGIFNIICYLIGLWIEITNRVIEWEVLFYLCRAIQVCLASLCIQVVRAEHKAVCPTWLKRLFRIGGFLLAPSMIKFPYIVMFVSIFSPFIAILFKKHTKKAEEDFIQKETGKKENYSLVMIFHQMHYFVYTYIMPLTVVELTKSFYLGMIIYALTWVVYLLPQWFAERKEIKEEGTKQIFFLCHIFLAVIMGTLAIAFFMECVELGLFAWLLTGLGGGSVFCIKQLKWEREHCDIIRSENIGHFLGVMVAVGMAVLIDYRIGMVLTGLSCIFVCLALLAAIFGLRSEKKKEQGQEEEAAYDLYK